MSDPKKGQGVSERFVWIGPIRHIGGYGEVARGYLEGLQRIGAEVVAVDSHGPIGAPDALSLAKLAPLLRGPVREQGATCVYHSAPADLARLTKDFPMPRAERRVACTIAETDRISAAAVEALTPFDEVWVPSAFQRESFARSGVPRSKLRVVRYGIDTESWSRESEGGPVAAGVGASPTLAPEAPPFRLLYCFQLGWRKGFDLLLEAYLSEFSREDDVELVLKLLAAGPGGPTRADLVRSVADRIDFFSPELPRVRVVEEELGREAMGRLYRETDLYISTDRANGWGMPCHEAMSCGTACAVIDWSGSTEFMHEGNALLIPAGELVEIDARLVASNPDQAGERWPHVEVADVQRAMREAFCDRERLREIGERAAAEVRAEWSLEAAARAIVDRNRVPYRARPGLLDKFLPGFGLRAPSTLLEGARSRALLCAFHPERDDWRAPLARYLESFAAGDDVTLCLWVDAETDAGLEGLGAEIEALLLERAGPGGSLEDLPDLQLTFAPLDHVPWERVEIDEAYRARPVSKSQAA